jgi:hypothetical protein
MALPHVSNLNSVAVVDAESAARPGVAKLHRELDVSAEKDDKDEARTSRLET